jgi:hypothetical protein
LHRDLVDEVLLSTGRTEQRVRLLPARVVVYFVMGLCLFRGESYEEVMRRLAQGLRFLGSWSDKWRVPTAGALTRARERLGPEPLRELFAQVAVPMAQPGTRGAWLRDLRLMCIDGTILDVPDTEANDERFGRSGNDIADAPFPQVRLVGLAECGTRAIVAASLGAYRESENELSDHIRPFCEAGMLIIADRNFFGHQRWSDFRATGADLLWRVQENVLLPCYETYADGSYLSVLTTQKQRQHAARRRATTRTEVMEGQPVRVVEYMITNRQETTETICLITTILDSEEAPAHELAQAYHDRWQIETAFGEIKTILLDSGQPLRSKSPKLVEQEIWALLLTHYALSDLRREAADDIEEENYRISFLRSLRIIRRQIAGQAAFSPSTPDSGDS